MGDKLLTEGERKQLDELAGKLEEESERGEEFFKETSKTLDEWDKSLDEIEKGLEELEELEELKEIIEEVLHGLEEGYSVTKARLPRDYNKIKRIQKEGYGKVHWRLMDMILYRLAGSKEYIIQAYGKEVGFLHTRRVNKDTLHILNFCFLPDYQNKGLGTKTLNKVIKDNEDRYLYITLKVRETNLKAISVYKNIGFIETGRDKRYYRDTKEDAIRMAFGVKKD